MPGGSGDGEETAGKSDRQARERLHGSAPGVVPGEAQGVAGEDRQAVHCGSEAGIGCPSEGERRGTTGINWNEWNGTLAGYWWLIEKGPEGGGEVMNRPRAMTEDECRDETLKHIAALVRYWHDESRAPAALEKMNGLVHSLLVLIDGGSGMMPGFTFSPMSTADDREFWRKKGTNWWPEDTDIGGSLHEHWHKFKPGRKGEGN